MDLDELVFHPWTVQGPRSVPTLVGGSGSYVGTVAGVLIILALQTILSVAQISEAGRDVIFGLIILAMVVLYGRQQQAAA